MFRSRSVLALALGGLAVAGLLAAWLATGWGDARARAAAIEARPARAAKDKAVELAGELGAAFDEIRAAENARPYYEYQNLFHDPRGASAGLSVTPSPLAERTADPLIAAHYQIDAKGTLTIPPVNEELPELSQQLELAGNRALLSRLRAEVAGLGGDLTEQAPAVAVAKKPRPRRKRPVETIQRVDPSAFAQNAMANQVFQEIQAQSPDAPAQKRNAVEIPPQQANAGPAAPVAKPRAKPKRRRAQREPPKPIEIRIASFAWRTSTVDGRPQIVATRTVRTPAGTLAQGFVIDRDQVSRFLRERGGEAAVLASEAEERVGASAALPGVPGWGVSLDYADALGAAGLEAAQVRARFWWWFVPAALFALLAFVAIVWVVRRAERLARERSRFAAAAAHELRTPLAGLQLYGEMLADGLGDPSQAHRYAQRVSDEAARLGRVVGNVLGFTQLERGSLAVEATPGDLAVATRRAVERVRPALEAAGMTVDVEIPERLLARFDDDAHARIVTNLLDNAEKYSRDCPERRVWLSLRESSDGALLTVSDSGAGVPERARERIFLPFSREVAEGDDSAAGLGLGLALARTLARDQGGDLFCADNQAGQGACFVLRLPLV